MSTNFALLHFEVFSFGCVLFIFILCRKKKNSEENKQKMLKNLHNLMVRATPKMKRKTDGQTESKKEIARERERVKQTDR